MHLSFCSFFLRQERKFNPRAYPCVYLAKENEFRKTKKKQDITKEKTEETKKDLNAYKDHVQWDKLPVFFMTKTGIDEYIDSNKVKSIPKNL
mgnify:CR=1 FL=1